MMTDRLCGGRRWPLDLGWRLSPPAGPLSLAGHDEGEGYYGDGGVSRKQKVGATIGDASERVSHK